MYALVRFELAEFDHWREVFEERGATRAEHGCLGGRLFTRSDNPDRAVILAEWDTAEAVEAYFDSTEFRRAMQDAGVKRKPDVTLLEAIDSGVVPPEPAAEDDADHDDGPGGTATDDGTRGDERPSEGSDDP